MVSGMAEALSQRQLLSLLLAVKLLAQRFLGNVHSVSRCVCKTSYLSTSLPPPFSHCQAAAKRRTKTQVAQIQKDGGLSQMERGHSHPGHFFMAL